MTERRPTDLEILAAAVAGLVGVLLGLPLMLDLVSAFADPPSLVSRLAPAETVRPFWVFFVLLPTSLAFIAIGLPFAFRLVLALFRSRLPAADVGKLAALASCLAAIGWELFSGRSGAWSLTATLVVSAVTARRPLAAFGARGAGWTLVAAGASITVFAYYAHALAEGGEPSVAIAPTFAVAGFVCAATGLLTATIRALCRARVALRALAGAWIAAAGWIVSPALAGRGPAGVPPDIFESYVIAGAGVLLAAFGLVLARRRE